MENGLGQRALNVEPFDVRHALARQRGDAVIQGGAPHLRKVAEIQIGFAVDAVEQPLQIAQHPAAQLAVRHQVAHLCFLLFLRFVVGQHVEQHRLHFVARRQALAVLTIAIALAAQIAAVVVGGAYRSCSGARVEAQLPQAVQREFVAFAEPGLQAQPRIVGASPSGCHSVRLPSSSASSLPSASG